MMLAPKERRRCQVSLQVYRRGSVDAILDIVRSPRDANGFRCRWEYLIAESVGKLLLLSFESV